MKKYILTIKYDEDTDTVEYMQEEILVYKEVKELDKADISKLTSEDMETIMEDKDYGKA
jgi:hypothetical protein